MVDGTFLHPIAKGYVRFPQSHQSITGSNRERIFFPKEELEAGRGRARARGEVQIRLGR